MQVIGAIIALIVFVAMWVLLPALCVAIGWVMCWIYELGRRAFFNHAAHQSKIDQLAKTSN